MKSFFLILVFFISVAFMPTAKIPSCYTDYKGTTENYILKSSERKKLETLLTISKTLRVGDKKKRKFSIVDSYTITYQNSKSEEIVVGISASSSKKYKEFGIDSYRYNLSHFKKGYIFPLPLSEETQQYYPMYGYGIRDSIEDKGNNKYQVMFYPTEKICVLFIFTDIEEKQRDEFIIAYSKYISECTK